MLGELVSPSIRQAVVNVVPIDFHSSDKNRGDCCCVDGDGDDDDDDDDDGS